ncbi:MAG TPA: tetratricopeptide repeat protein [Pirellulales bacterium]|nr:tetratricopeptide repeat protein [Pirellulales bacterium]
MLRFATGLTMLALFAGCDNAAPPTTTAPQGETSKVEQAVHILDYVAGLLNSPAETDVVESTSWDILDYNEAARRALESGVPPVLVPQLNQWIVLQSPLADWHRDPLLDTLPGELRRLPQVKDLDTMGFSPPDGIDLRQAIWLRDASNWAAGATQDDLERSRRIFDWIVRNIQLDPPYDEDTVRRQAWQALLLGHGPAEDRAWLFTLMARQQGLDVVMLATGQEDAAEPWLPALFHEGELYLFDPSLGLPIPGPEGKGIATLSQVAADDSLLRHLDVDDDHRYGRSAAEIEQVTVLIEASPMYLSQRMALLESQLAGEQSVVLSVDASALADRLHEVKHVSDVRLWSLPYERLAEQALKGRKGRQKIAGDFEPFMVPFPRQIKKKTELTPALWKGRVLHVLGQFTGEPGAMKYYQIARPSDQDLARGPALTAVEQEDLRGKVPPDEWTAAGERFLKIAPVAKHYASYWLGLIAFERNDYKTAANYFSKRTLDVNPDTPWRSGALYNLARAEELLGRNDDAVELYRQIESPQRHGNLLRARWLEESTKSK